MLGRREEGWLEYALAMAFLTTVTVSIIRELTVVNVPMTGNAGEALHPVHHHLGAVRFVAVCAGHRPMMFLQRKPACGVLRHSKGGRFETIDGVTTVTVKRRAFRIKLSTVRIAAVTITASRKCNRPGKVCVQMTPRAFNSSVFAQKRVPGI